MTYVLGIDQGGSKTAAVVMDEEGRILGAGRSAGAQYLASGMAAAVEAVARASREALEAASIGLDRISRVSAGMTGADWPEEYTLLRNALQAWLGRPVVQIHNDCMAALRGGTERPYGAVICAGSGLNVGVRSPGGAVYVFGYYVDEEYQGATALGRRAIRAVIAAAAGAAPETALTAVVLRKLRVPSVEQLLRAQSAGGAQPQPHLLAPDLVAAAGEGDRVAAGILDDFGGGVARYVASGLRRLAMLEMDVDVVLSGGVFTSPSPILRRGLRSALAAVSPRARTVEAAYEPVVGAALLGLEEERGSPVDARVLQTVRSSSAQHGLIRAVS